MNADPKSCSDLSFVSLSQRTIEALGRLQARQSDTKLASLYIYDLVDQCNLNISGSIATLLGYSDEAIQSGGLTHGLATLIHPQDLACVSNHYQRFTTLKSDQVITLDYRMKRVDGVWCWLRSQETPLVMAIDGFPLQILGLVQPIALLSPTRSRKLAMSSKVFSPSRRVRTKISLTRRGKPDSSQPPR